MLFPILIIIALIGAAVLGFLSAWTMRQKSIDAAQEEVKEAMVKVAEAEAQVTKVSEETRSTQLTLERLQKENQALETEQIQLQSDLRVKTAELQVMARDKRLLEEELTQLQDEISADIREIEVVREVPVYENKNGESDSEDQPAENVPPSQVRVEKAKELVKAFRRGVKETDG